MLVHSILGLRENEAALDNPWVLVLWLNINAKENFLFGDEREGPVKTYPVSKKNLVSIDLKYLFVDQSLSHLAMCPLRQQQLSAHDVKPQALVVLDLSDKSYIKL